MANTERVKEAVARAGLDAVLLMDDRDIYYATGFLPTDSAALVGAEGAWLVTDSRYIEAAQKQAAPGVEVLLTTRERPLGAILRELADRLGIEKLGAEEEKLSHALYLRMERALGRELLPAQELLVSLRSCKTEEELREPRRRAEDSGKGPGGGPASPEARRGGAGDRRRDSPTAMRLHGARGELLRPHRRHRREEQHAPRRPGGRAHRGGRLRHHGLRLREGRLLLRHDPHRRRGPAPRMR